MTISEPLDSQETTSLLAQVEGTHVASHTENAGGSAVDGAALRRNEEDGEPGSIQNLSPHVLNRSSM